MELRDSTGDPAADRIVRGVVGLFEAAFPGRVGGYYLRGSHASGTATAGSDLDLFVVFRDSFQGPGGEPGEAERARTVAAAAARLCPVVLEILVVSADALAREVPAVTVLQLARSTRLLYGTDLRPELPAYSVDSYVRSVVQTPVAVRRALTPGGDPVLTWPVPHPDPATRFRGYDRPAGPDQPPGTKLLVALVCWTATATVALWTGDYVADKGAAVAAYREHVGDAWTSLVTGVYQDCRNRWGYLLPSDPADRRRLAAWCDRAGDFLNHYLAHHYRPYLHAERDSGVPDRQALARRRLDQLHFPDAAVIG